MKKYTILFLAVLLMPVCTWSQKALKQLPTSSIPKMADGTQKSQPSQQSLQRQVDLDRMMSARAAFSKKTSKAKGTTTAGRLKAPIEGDYELITETPDGTLLNCTRSGQAYMVLSFYIFNTTVHNGVCNVVLGENNTIYIKNIISQYNTGSWVKGTINGSTITIDFPQKAMEMSGTSYYVDLLSYDEQEQWYLPKDGPRRLTLDYDPVTNSISTPAGSAFASSEDVVALVDKDDGWTGYADWDINVSKMDAETVAAPAGLETSDYSITAEEYEGSLVKVGFQGTDIYVQGISYTMPDAWVKGTVVGDKVIFKNGQYIGPDEQSGYHQFLVSAEGKKTWDNDQGKIVTHYNLTEGDIEFDYDEATKTLSNGSTFLVNAGTDEVYYLSAFTKALIKPFTEVAATPLKPKKLSLEEGGIDFYQNGWGWGVLTFDLSTKDVEGNYILPEKLTYQLYTRVNGEEKPMTLEAGEFIYLDEDMTEIPFDFTENWDIYINGATRNIYYHVIGPEAFGVQAIYRGLGEERRSEIAWVNVQGLGSTTQPEAATPSYPDIDPSNVGGSIKYGYFTGEEDVNLFGEKKEATYDVAIHIDHPDLVGTYIESITIPMVEVKGISGISAWLSSQLRIEDGKNVPDLVSMDLTPDEAGFITVKLDKPYVIPEEGVYVGYTFTVDDASIELNQTPVAVMDTKAYKGFFLHTSKGFMKWLNLSFEFMMNSVIQVTVGGSKVKEYNVVAASDMPTYVLAGSPIDVDLGFVNIGASEVNSVDFEYTLDGKSGTGHIDLSEPVAGFYGKYFSAPFTFPPVDTSGNYDLEIQVTKVNGHDDEGLADAAIIPLLVINSFPKHRSLIEEYTGTWCGYCPRGLVAMEQLAELYPDDYVRVSYHNGDPMEIMSSDYFPNYVGGYPDAFVDRFFEVDPYYGSTGEAMGIIDDLNLRASEFGQATINIVPTLSKNRETVTVNTEVTFATDHEGAKYALEYILVADSLTGTTNDWVQSNYYADGSMGEMGGFESMESSIVGIPYNDVAIQMSRIGGITGSLPSTIKAERLLKHTFRFQLANSLNTRMESLIQDLNKLRVVVLLIDQEYGLVVNANSAPVTDADSIVEVEGTNGKVTRVEFYDLSGRRVNASHRGASIMRTTYSDGTVKTVKVMR
ncbi:MAG: thioredoxin family protein [Prevotella sp.]|nr:thioredoxin family protein [Prevotella sp.]